jgi:hypothetical protein
LKNAFPKRNCSAADGVHVREATIQSAFTSLALAFECVAAEIGDTAQSEYPGKFEEVDMNGTKVLGLAAVGAFLIVAAPVERAQAVSLINPGAAGTIQEDSKQLTTEVRWHHHHHWRHHRWHHRHWRHHRWHRHHHRRWY